VSAAVVRALLRRAGWVLHRWPPHRFDAMEDTLRLLHANGYRPKVVVDIGANVGHWTALADRIFDAREYHLVEPQPACRAALARFARPRFTVHPTALTAAGVREVSLLGAGSTSENTGARVAAPGESTAEALGVPALSLDELLGGAVHRADRPLLKLDVECHELQVLAAGLSVLAESEVVILEFHLFRFEGSWQPIFEDAIAFMRGQGFVLYDLASLASRRRDQRLRTGDAVFVRADSPLAADDRWS
jgi:FkbM family methyltransferase